jgi:hypothetical protein
MKAENVKLPYGAICCALLLSLSGCATNSPTPVACLPPMPAESRPKLSLSTPLPSVSYSLSAAESERASQQKLMGTRLMRDYSTSSSNPKEKP